jgi:hypothetical protein
MKFSTTLLTATAMAGIAAIAPSANATILLATVNGGYSTSFFDDASATLTNNTGVTENNVVLAGVGFGSLAAGATTGPVSLGDYDDSGGVSPINASFTVGSKSFSGSFGVPGFMTCECYGATGTVGTISGTIPEPATLAVLGASLLGLGAARRFRG